MQQFLYFDPSGRADASGTIDDPMSHPKRALEKNIIRKDATLFLNSGIYREGSIFINRSDINFVAVGQVEITGFRLMENWTKVSGTTFNLWEHKPIAGLFHRISQHVGEYYTRPEVMRVNGKTIYNMLSLTDMTSSNQPRFFVDGPSKDPNRIILSLPPEKNPGEYVIEFGADEYILRGANDVKNISFDSIIWTGGATSDKGGAVASNGIYWKFNNCVFKDNSQAGLLASGNEHHFYRNKFLNNGVSGLDGNYCISSTFLRNEIAYNNYRKYPPNWHTNKFSNSRNNSFILHYGHDNYGPALWFDIDNDVNEIRNSVLIDNYRVNLMIELRSTNTFVVDTILARARKDDDGQARNLQIQAAEKIYIERMINVLSEGDGIRYKHNDDRADSGLLTIKDSKIGYNAFDFRFETNDPIGKGDLFINNEWVGNPTTSFGGFYDWISKVNSINEIMALDKKGDIYNTVNSEIENISTLV